MYDSCMLLGFPHWFWHFKCFISPDQDEEKRKPKGQSMIDSQGHLTRETENRTKKKKKKKKKRLTKHKNSGAL